MAIAAESTVTKKFSWLHTQCLHWALLLRMFHTPYVKLMQKIRSEIDMCGTQGWSVVNANVAGGEIHRRCCRVRLDRRDFHID
jgi:hypothetical protein